MDPVTPEHSKKSLKVSHVADVGMNDSCWLHAVGVCYDFDDFLEVGPHMFIVVDPLEVELRIPCFMSAVDS
jgi:hypothetical protein